MGTTDEGGIQNTLFECYAAHRVRTEGEAAPQSALETKFGVEAAGLYTNSFQVRAETKSFLRMLPASPGALVSSPRLPT